MLKSMTGFGRDEFVNEECKISVEIKGVNHRYLDLSMKMPKKFNPFEAKIRGLLKQYILRGKVDAFINYESYSPQKVSLKYNSSLAAEYINCFLRMEEEFGIQNDMSTSVLSRCPEVLTMEQAAEQEEALWELLTPVIRNAAERFAQSRLSEGKNLKEDLLEKLDTMLELVSFIEERSPQVIQEYRKKLEDKVKELLDNNNMDESRILTEVTIFADKICVDEEVVRLKSHVESMKKALNAGGGIGRQLDFIAQEMNREANTMLSKSNDLGLSEKAITLKTEIEKVREQIQNIE